MSRLQSYHSLYNPYSAGLLLFIDSDGPLPDSAGLMERQARSPQCEDGPKVAEGEGFGFEDALHRREVDEAELGDEGS